MLADGDKHEASGIPISQSGQPRRGKRLMVSISRDCVEISHPICHIRGYSRTPAASKGAPIALSHEINHHQPLSLILPHQEEVAIGTHRSRVASCIVEDAIFALAPFA